MKKLEIYEMGDPFPLQISARDGKITVYIANQLASLTREEAEEAIWVLHTVIDELPRSNRLCKIPEHMPGFEAVKQLAAEPFNLNDFRPPTEFGPSDP